MLERVFTLPAFAKINLHLRVLGKQRDGYHELCTVFQTVSLADELSFSPHQTVELICADKKIPCGEANIIVKTAKILREKFNVKAGAKILLDKKIPAPGGLGGGSSNAATTLIGLVKLWQIKTSIAELSEIACTTGADVPFFLHGGTALGVGRGTEIFPIEDFTAKHLLIVTPDADVPTAQAFERLNAADLTNKTSKRILEVCRQEAETAILRQLNRINDFEKVIFEIEPEIRRVKEKLLETGSESALMSGSGASVFAVFANGEKLQNALETLQVEKKWRVFPVETVSRRRYRKLLNFAEIFGRQ